MKLKSTILAAALTIFTISATAIAAEVEVQNSGSPEQGEVRKPVKKPMKKHNHMEEKLGMPMPEPTGGKSHRETMDKDMPMHDHTQEKH